MRNIVRLIAGMAAAAVFAPMASADPSLECSADTGSQVETGACLAEVAKRADAALAIALSIAKDAARELDEVTGRKAAVPGLEIGQKSWLAYRDAHCDWIGATYGGGSGTGIAIQSCRIELTRTRIRALLRAAG